MTLLLVLNRPPYDGTDGTWNALRLAQTAVEEGHAVTLFLMNQAVDLARKGATPDRAEFDLGKMLLEIEQAGAQVRLCTTCINRCGLGKGDLLNGEWPAGMKDLVGWIEQADKVLTF